MAKGYLQTGQTLCYDSAGSVISCQGSGQDAAFTAGIPRPAARFLLQGDVVLDTLTGLTWCRDANLTEFPLPWQEAFEYIAELNQRQGFGFSDWRLPNRRELLSLMDYQKTKPPLSTGHPFVNIFQGWYWTATTAAINPAYAWYVHLAGARTFYGRKDQYCFLWSVRGKGNNLLPRTGQDLCYDAAGREIPCRNSGQDGAIRTGYPWPEPRFVVRGETVVDRVTNLCWLQRADITHKPVNWAEAFAAVEQLNAARHPGTSEWRLPNINELESLVDCANHSPALPAGHPFVEVKDEYWSSTTSVFEPNWAWALYLRKGALGVGMKQGRHFYVWPVCECPEQ
jgi:hypothetical protein